MLNEFDIRKHEKLARDLGTVAVAALQDPLTTEVLYNPSGELWCERLGEPMQCIGKLAPSRAEAVIKLVASHLKKVVTSTSPTVEGVLPPEGYRFAGQVWPVVADGPAFSIRKPATRVFELDEYLGQGALSEQHRSVLGEAVRAHRNILVAGGCSSGKTTLCNALIAELVRADPTARVITLEDDPELQCSARNRVAYLTSEERSMTDLLRTSLRMRPDRILVGEVRGPEALDLLMAWNSGHEGGAATLHANSAVAALSKLAMLVSMSPMAPRDIAPFVADAVHLVVHTARTPEGRRIKEIVEVTGLDNRGGYATRAI